MFVIEYVVALKISNYNSIIFAAILGFLVNKVPNLEVSDTTDDAQ